MMRRALLASAIPLLLVAPARGDWDSSAAIALGAYYSDNICQVPRDLESEPVGTVTPSISVRGEGGRSTTSLDAAVEFNSLGESDITCPQGGVGLNPANRETWVPRLNLRSEFEAVENLLFLEADGLASQNPINPFAAGGDDNLNATGNTNITYRWGVGARFERQFNAVWALLARYNYNEQYNSVNRAIGDSQEDRFEFDFGKIPGASRFAYGVRGQYSEITFEENDIQPEFTNRLSRVELRLAFQASREWQFNASAGEEDNVFLSNSDEIDGFYWDAGVQWTPNSRVLLDVGYGERFFGETPRVSLQYRHKRSAISASYVRDLRFPRNIRGPAGQFPDDGFTDPVPGDPGDPLGSAGGPTFIGQSPVLDERFSLSYSLTGRRSTLSIGASQSKQTRAVNNSQGDFFSVNIGFNRDLGRRLSVQAGVDYTENEGDLGAGVAGQFFQDREAWRAYVGVRRGLSNQSSISLRYRYTDQVSTLTNATFEENRLEATFSHRF